MTALALAFHSVDHIACFTLNYRKCCWVQYGTEERESLWHWLSENCEEFREMQIVRHAKYVGTMNGPDGHLHCWTAHRKNHPAQARQPLLTAWGRIAKSARGCPPRPSRRFAKCAVDQWVLHSQGTIAFASTRCGKLFCSSYFTPRAPVLPTRWSA